MPSIDSYRKTRWLTKANVTALSAAQRRTFIDRIIDEEVGDEFKPVCYFRGVEKGWPINMTAFDVLKTITGSEFTEDYPGVAVEIYVDPNVKFRGERIGGIKLRARKVDDRDDIDDAMQALTDLPSE